MKLLNQKGSALTISMIALAVLGAASVTMFKKAQDNKVGQSTLAKTHYYRLFQKKVATLLNDTETCKKNFTQLSPNLIDLKDSRNRPVYQINHFYEGQAVKFEGMRAIAHTDPNKFRAEIISSKVLLNGQRQSQTLNLDVTAVFDTTNNTITSCQFEGNDPLDLEAALEQPILDLCHGPGMISNTSSRCIIQRTNNGWDLNIPLAPPSPLALENVSMDGSTHKLSAGIASVILETNDTGSPCQYGIKYLNDPGKWKCLQLAEIVNTDIADKVPTAVGSNCRIDVVAQKYKFLCGP